VKPNPAPDGWPTVAQTQQWSAQFIDCSSVTNQDVLTDFCQFIFPFQEKDLNNPHLPTLYKVVMAGPAGLQSGPQGLCKTISIGPFVAAASDLPPGRLAAGVRRPAAGR
jgi:hypothetical protein